MPLRRLQVIITLKDRMQADIGTHSGSTAFGRLAVIYNEIMFDFICLFVARKCDNNYFAENIKNFASNF